MSPARVKVRSQPIVVQGNLILESGIQIDDEHGEVIEVPASKADDTVPKEGATLF